MFFVFFNLQYFFYIAKKNFNLYKPKKLPVFLKKFFINYKIREKLAFF